MVSVSVIPFTLEGACTEIEELPKMSLSGNPTIQLEGGTCLVDEGFLQLAIGNISNWDALIQPDPWPNMYAIVFIRAQPGTWDTGTFHIAPTGSGFQDNTGGLVMTMSEDLLTGSFTFKSGSGSYSCPRLLTADELRAGP